MYLKFKKRLQNGYFKPQTCKIGIDNKESFIVETGDVRR